MGFNTGPLFAPQIYSAMSSPIMVFRQNSPGIATPPSLHPEAFRTTKSASPEAQPQYAQKGKLPPLDTAAANAHGFKIQPPSPGEPGMFVVGNSPSLTHSQDIALASPKFPISPRTSDDDQARGFTPYYMDIVQPKAPELQQQPSRQSSTRRSKRALGTGLQSPEMSPPITSGSLSSSIESMQRQDTEKTAMRLKRSLTTLLQRSSSVLRRSNSNLRRQSTTVSRYRRGSRSEEPTPFVRSEEPTPPPESAMRGPETLRYSDLTTALAASQFHVSAENTLVSPLIGNSMIHIKVVMDDGTAVIVPMVRSIVFARARERILAKLFQGGVPLVETKRRKLAVRRPDGSMAAIRDNQTWRIAMDVAGEAKRQQAREIVGGALMPCSAPVPGCAMPRKTVVKLTLHLTDAF
ncbi:hypothetical protein IWW50_003568 [Coemansia erecta]|nr:hypothetical protein GGF43_002985 [Coemansia sp. RSA 2618]KAJ2823934.1 hypothetical protein IWW50_003568 [Coemansia erecta]